MSLALGANEQSDQSTRANSGRDESIEVRQLVKVPPRLLQWELAQMRGRLATLGQLQAALSRGVYGETGDLAEKNLGMSWLATPLAQEVANYMPQEMREMETDLHRAASRFAVEATNAGATGDVRPANAALTEVMQKCVACHAAYRFR